MMSVVLGISSFFGLLFMILSCELVPVVALFALPTLSTGLALLPMVAAG